MNNEKLLKMVPIDFGGGCSLSKADLMFGLIKKYSIKESIDIGVYRGRSLLPQALAHKLHTGGIVYGVDPYDNDLVGENDNAELKEQIADFIKNNDFDKIYIDVIKLLDDTGLSKNATIVRKTSSDAIEYFQNNQLRPRLIHIDGNHDTAIVMEDVSNYLKILGENGFIVMDDVSWSSVKPADQRSSRSARSRR